MDVVTAATHLPGTQGLTSDAELLLPDPPTCESNVDSDSSKTLDEGNEDDGGVERVASAMEVVPARQPPVTRMTRPSGNWGVTKVRKHNRKGRHQPKQGDLKQIAKAFRTYQTCVSGGGGGVNLSMS